MSQFMARRFRTFRGFVPMLDYGLGRTQRGFNGKCLAVARGLWCLAWAPDSPVPTVIGGQSLYGQMVAAVMPSGCGCEERFIHFAPSRTHAWIPIRTTTSNDGM